MVTSGLSGRKLQIGVCMWPLHTTISKQQGSKSRLTPVRLGQVVSASAMASTGLIPKLDILSACEQTWMN